MIDKDFEMTTEQWHPTGRLVRVEPDYDPISLQEKLYPEGLISLENRMWKAIESIEASDRVYHDTIKYGQLVSAAMLGGGFSSQCKVHFFNKRGVLIGNIYEFIPYERLRLHHKGIVWERIAYGKKYERLKQWTYETLCQIITILLKVTQRLSQ